MGVGVGVGVSMNVDMVCGCVRCCVFSASG